MKFGIMLFLVFVLFLTSAFTVFGQLASDSNTLHVSFENNVAPSYEVNLDPNEKFILSQSYSWIRDQNSRYNLISYSIDDGEFVSISRLPRGNFTLDIPTDSSYSIVFLAVTQYPISVEGAEAFSFLPESPTNDNWFDVESEVNITVTPPSEGLIPYELDGWDGPVIKSDANSALVLVDAPTIIEAKWKQNYLSLTLFIIIPIVGIVTFFVLRSRNYKVAQKQVQVVSTGNQEDIDSYDEKIKQYLKQKSLEKLDSMFGSKIMTDAVYSRVKEKLEELG